MIGEGNTYLHPNLPVDTSDAALSQALLVFGFYPTSLGYTAQMTAIPQKQLKKYGFFPEGKEFQEGDMESFF